MTGFDGETVYIVGDMVWRWDEYGGLWRSFISGKRIDRRIDPLADEAIMSRRTVEDKTDNGFCPMWVVLLYNFSKSDPLDLVHAGEAVVLYDIDTTLFWPKRIWIEAVGILRRQLSHGRDHHGALWFDVSTGLICQRQYVYREDDVCPFIIWNGGNAFGNQVIPCFDSGTSV